MITDTINAWIGTGILAGVAMAVISALTAGLVSILTATYRYIRYGTCNTKAVVILMARKARERAEASKRPTQLEGFGADHD